MQFSGVLVFLRTYCAVSGILLVIKKNILDNFCGVDFLKFYFADFFETFSLKSSNMLTLGKTKLSNFCYFLQMSKQNFEVSFWTFSFCIHDEILCLQVSLAIQLFVAFGTYHIVYRFSQYTVRKLKVAMKINFNQFPKW